MEGTTPMTMEEFIDEHRAEIDAHIRRVVPNLDLDDEEREAWIMQDEGLYQWAQNKQVQEL